MVKRFAKQVTAFLLVLILMVSMIPFTASAASTSTTIDGVSISYDNSKFSYANGTFTITPSESSGCTGTTYSTKTGDLTINKGSANSNKYLKFQYSASIATNGSLKIAGTATTEVTGEIILNKTESTKTITLASGNAAGAKSTITLSGFEYYDPDEVFGITVIGAAHGTVTIGSTTLEDGDDEEFEASYNSGLQISVQPDTGYTFLGFVDDSNIKQDLDANGYLRPTYEMEITPVFAQTNIDPVFSVGNMLFTSFSGAASASATAKKPMIPVQNCTLPSGNYTIPKNATLLIPFDEGGTLYKDVPVVEYNSYTTPTAYRTMKMVNGAKITVQSGGAISVGSKLSSKAQLGGTNGCPTGPDGRIEMLTGSKITLDSGANLYTWGYIFGSGEIEALSGSTVYEAFQVKDWRGGSATSDVYSYAFIFSQYYIQNIEVALKLNYGATENLYSSVNASSAAHPISAKFIGNASGYMFKLTSSDGYLLKDYIEGKDKVSYQMYGNASICPLTISGVPIVGTVSTEDYTLPLNGGMMIDVKSGTTTVEQDLEMLPGTVVSVQQNAEVKIDSGKKVCLYDVDDWGNFTGSAKMYAVGYSVANGTTAIRTAANMPSARIDVNGTFTVSGSLYTSNGGADITSTIGTVGEHGKLVFGTAPSGNTTIYEMADNSTKTSVTMYPPKLHNGDDTYSATAGTGTSTWKYDKPGEHWYRYLVDFKYNDTLIDRGYFCENDDTVSYDASWLTDLGATASSGTATLSGTTVNVTRVTADSIVTLTGTPAEYNPTFVLNEKEYSVYQLYTGNTISETTEIDGNTYYIVKQNDAPLPVGTAYEKPTDASMGVTAANHNSITWNMSGISVSSGDPYRDVVPAGATAQGPVYIYGFYSGVVAYNDYTDDYYVTLIDAFADTPSDATATITLLADCGTFAAEYGTTAYSIYPNNNITLDLNGHKALGCVINQGIFNLDLNGGTFDYHTGATAAASGYRAKAAVINNATLNISDTNDGGVLTTDVVQDNSTLSNYAAAVRNNAGATMNVTGGTLATTQNVNSYSAVILNYGTFNSSDASLTRVKGYSIQNSGTADVDMNGKALTGSVTNNASSTIDLSLGGTAMTGVITNNGTTFNLDLGGGTVTATSTTAPVTNAAGSTLNIDLNGGTIQYATGLTAANSSYRGKAAVINNGSLTIKDTAGDGIITSDAIDDSSSLTNYASVVRNNSGATLTMTGGTLQNKPASVNNYSTALLNYGTASISDSTLTTSRGYGIYNASTGTVTLLKDSEVSVTHKSGAYAVMNSTGMINEINGSSLSTINTNVLYNNSGATVTTLKNTDISITAPTTANVYAVFNYGSTITTMDNCTITGNSGINNRNLRGNANTAADGATISKYGNIGTIKDTTVNVGMYALYNGATIGTLIGSTFTAHPASAQVPWSSGTAALNGNSVHAYTIVNSNLWWYDSAVWKRTDTSVDNNGTTMLQRRVDEYKTDDAYMPTIGAITDCTIKAQNTSTSNSYGYYALQNLGVINTIDGNTTITAEKHPDNAKTVYGYYAVRNESGGKIGSIGSDVTINAYNYALTNLGARYAQTDTTYSTTYLASGALKSGGLATDYDYTYADVSTIGSTAATISSTSQYAVLNYSKIGSITGTISANYNVIVNAGAAATTTGIEGTTANSRAIEHRYFENNDSSATANEYRREFEYTRNTEDGCYIGTIDATVTATKKGYQAISNQGYIGTIAGEIKTVSGLAASGTTYYPLITNAGQRQATLKQTEDYYVEENGYGATRYDREYTCEVPTIDTISCTATNPQDYTIRNRGIINNLTGNISGKMTTVANEADGAYLTRKTRTFYYSSSRFAAGTASSEVDLEYTMISPEIKNITGATITATGGAHALRNYGKIGTVTGSEITATTYPTVLNGGADDLSAITAYTSNRADVLTGCTYTPKTDTAAASTALKYDTTQTISENEERAVSTIDTIGAGNYIASSSYRALDNCGRINTIDSGDGDKTIIYAASRNAVYNYSGQYSKRTNTNAELTAATGTLTNNYSCEYAPAYIGTIKNVFILGKRQAIVNGASTADPNYNPVTIGEIGEGAEIRTTATATYHACHNNTSNAKIEKITGGVFITGAGSGIYGLYNASTTYPIYITGGDFRGGDGTRALAIYQPDKTTRYTYPAGLKLSTDTETATYHTLSNKVLTANTSDFYYIPKTNTVSFDMQGHGDEVAEQNVVVNAKATQPESPAVNSVVEESGTKFRFDGWYTDDTFENAFDFDTAITEDTTVYAKWTRLYTVTWKNGADTIKTEDVASGETPSYTGDTPTKDADAQYTYTFSGWVPAPAPIAADTTYVANFNQTLNTYTVTWKNGDKVLETDNDVPYGTSPAYNSDTPEKTGDAQYTYTFAGWSTDGSTVIDPLPDVTENATYTAVFTSTVNNYTVKWTVDESAPEADVKAAVDAVIANHAESVYNAVKAEYSAYGIWGGVNDHITFIQLTLQGEYGLSFEDAGYVAAQMVNVMEDNAAAAAAESSWNEVKDTVAAGLATSTLTTAAEKSELNALAGGITTLETDSSVPYGTVPTFNGETPTKAGDAQYTYTFAGWSTDGSTVIDPLPGVTADVTYKAVFDQTVNTYTVKWTVDGSASEADVKATVDAIIANHAASIYNAAKAEASDIWDWLGHAENVEYYMLDQYFGGGSTNDTSYIANKIVAIQENNASIAATAESKWDAAKDTIVEKLLSSHDLLTAAETSELNALLAGSAVVVLETDANVPYGTVPTYNGATPTKAGDAQYSYTFAGWSTDGSNVIDPLPGVTADVTYKAVFEQSVNTYTITYVDENGVEQTEEITYGAKPELPDEEEMAKPKTAEKTYTFAGWESSTGETYESVDDIPPVTGTETYTPIYNETINQYTYTFVSDGTTLESETVNYGSNPEFDGATPTKAADDEYTYTFSGWDYEYFCIDENEAVPAGAQKEKVTSGSKGSGSEATDMWRIWGHVAAVNELPAIHGNMTITATFDQLLHAIKHSLTLDGEIGVNFYIPKDRVTDAENSTAKIYWGPETGVDHGEVEISLKDLTNEDKIWYHVTDNGLNTKNPIVKAKINGKYYQFTAFVAAKQMADVVTTDIFDKDETRVLRDTYRVADYCYEVINNKDGDVYAKMHAQDETITEQKFENLQELCKAMLTYGSKAQVQFGYNSDSDKLADKDLKNYTYTAAVASDFAEYYDDYYTSDVDEMSYYGASMLLEAETTYSLWFSYQDSGYNPPEATATIDGEEVTVELLPVPGNYNATYVRYNILNLPANLLSKEIIIDFNGVKKTFTPKTYYYLALSSGNTTLENTVSSLCNYNNAAVAYFG